MTPKAWLKNRRGHLLNGAMVYKNSSNEELCFPPFESRTLISSFNGLVPFIFCLLIIFSTLCLKRKRKASSIVADGRMNQVIGSFDTLSISDGEEIGIRRGSPWLKEIEELDLISNASQFQPFSYEGHSRERDCKGKFLVSPKLKFKSRMNDRLSHHTAFSLEPSNDVAWRLSTLNITHPNNRISDSRDEPMEWEGSTVSVSFVDNSPSVPLMKLTPFFRHPATIFITSLLAILIITYFIW